MLHDEKSREVYSFEKGRKEGIEQGFIATAKNLLNLNLPIETVIKATGLTEEKILELKNRY